MSCSNMAHVAAAAGEDKADILAQSDTLKPNIAIVTAYNDMLSAHQPYEGYPQLIKAAAVRPGATAQVAGGVPAMCDGVTQVGQAWNCPCSAAILLPCPQLSRCPIMSMMRPLPWGM